MAKKHKPIRMCVNCRERFLQTDLIRLQKDGDKVYKYKGIGRSFYICKDCLENSNFLLKKVSKILKIKEESLFLTLKEFKSNVKN